MLEGTACYTEGDMKVYGTYFHNLSIGNGRKQYREECCVLG
jgi:hypothetical protein